MRSLFIKVTSQISAFYKSVGNSITCIGMFDNVAHLKVSRNSLLTIVAGLHFIEMLPGILEIPEICQEMLCNGVRFSKFQVCKLQPSPFGVSRLLGNLLDSFK